MIQILILTLTNKGYVFMTNIKQIKNLGKTDNNTAITHITRLYRGKRIDLNQDLKNVYDKSYVLISYINSMKYPNKKFYSNVEKILL